MLDIKFVREHLDEVKTMLKNRCNSLDLSEFEGLEQRRRELLQETETLKARRNTVSKQVGQMKKNGEDATAVMAEMREVGSQISALDADLKDVEEKLRDIMLHIPNMPKEDVPIGKDDTENPEVRKWGEPRKFDFEPKAHWDIGSELDILDADRAAKVAGARFMFYKGLGARLERACIAFMMDNGNAGSLYRQQGQHGGHGPAAQVCRGHVQAGGAGLLPGAHWRGANDQLSPR